MRTKASAGKIRQTYEFIKANRNRFYVRTMCRVLEVAPSGTTPGFRNRSVSEPSRTLGSCG